MYLMCINLQLKKNERDIGSFYCLNEEKGKKCSTSFQRKTTEERKPWELIK